MERATKVTVFETGNKEDVAFYKEKLDEHQIINFLEEDQKDSYGIPLDATIFKLKVDLKDEQKAFQIIDENWKEVDN